MGQAYENFAADLLSACQLPKQLAALPIAFEKPVYGSNEPTFTEFMAPGKDTNNRKISTYIKHFSWVGGLLCLNFGSKF